MTPYRWISVSQFQSLDERRWFTREVHTLGRLQKQIYVSWATSPKSQQTVSYTRIGKDRQEYLGQIFRFKDVKVSQPVDSLSTLKDLVELDSFRSLLRYLYLWRDNTAKWNNETKLAVYKENKKVYCVGHWLLSQVLRSSAQITFSKTFDDTILYTSKKDHEKSWRKKKNFGK